VAEEDDVQQIGVGRLLQEQPAASRQTSSLINVKYNQKQMQQQTSLVTITKNSREHNKEQLKQLYCCITLPVSTVYTVIIWCLFMKLIHLKHKTKTMSNHLQYKTCRKCESSGRALVYYCLTSYTNIDYRVYLHGDFKF
jgi:hypothetical protein